MPRLIWKPSKGFCSRRGYNVDFVVLHYTWGHKAGDLATLCSRRASSHFYITNPGDIYWLVRLENTAYHAGISRLLAPKRAARIRPNERSVGIEIEGFGEFTEEQYRALEWLLPLLLKRFDIPLALPPNPYRGCDAKAKADRYEIEFFDDYRGLLAHGNIHRSKVDPGLNFDWERIKCIPPLPDPGCLSHSENVVYRGDPSELIPEGGISYEFKVAS